MMKNIFYMFIAVLVIACKAKPKVEEIDLTPILIAKIGKMNEGAKMRLHLQKELAFDWDYFLILSPYVDIKKVEVKRLNNYSSIKGLLSNITGNDGNCVLLFVKNNAAIKYSLVPRVPLDFSVLQEKHGQIPVISKSIDSESILIEKKAGTFLISY